MPEVLAAASVFRRWYRVLSGTPLVEWEEWAITEFDCLSVTTVLVWASKTFDHATLLALWLWGLATGVAAVIAAVIGALRVCRWAGRRRVCPVRSSRLPLGNDELRRAVAHEAQRALVDATGSCTAGPSASSLEWRAPSSPSRTVTRTVTPEEEEETAAEGRWFRTAALRMGGAVGEEHRCGVEEESSAIGEVRRRGETVGLEE